MAVGHDTFGQYLSGIGRWPTLSREDEARLGKAVMDGQQARTELESGGPLSPRRRRELRRLVAHGEKAAEEFLLCNLRLVVPIAKQYAWSGLALADLVQEGNIGLVRAISKFDWRKGFKFSTYATWWIRQAIHRAIENTSSTVRLPSHVRDHVRTARRIEKRAEDNLGCKPGVSELAAEMGVEEAYLRSALMFDKGPVSLDAPLQGEDMALEDFLADPGDAGFTELETKDQVNKLISSLSSEENQVLSLRFGLDGYDALPLAKVAEALGVSKKKARGIERAAVKKLREAVA